MATRYWFSAQYAHKGVVPDTAPDPTQPVPIVPPGGWPPTGGTYIWRPNNATRSVLNGSPLTTGDISDVNNTTWLTVGDGGPSQPASSFTGSTVVQYDMQTPPVPLSSVTSATIKWLVAHDLSLDGAAFDFTTELVVYMGVGLVYATGHVFGSGGDWTPAISNYAALSDIAQHTGFDVFQNSTVFPLVPVAGLSDIVADGALTAYLPTSSGTVQVAFQGTGFYFDSGSSTWLFDRGSWVISEFWVELTV